MGFMVEDLKLTLAINTYGSLKVVSYMREPHSNNLRLVAKVKPSITEDQLISSGQYPDLKYIVYQIINDGHITVEWHRSDKICSASSTESLSRAFEYMMSYTIRAMELMISSLED